MLVLLLFAGIYVVCRFFGITCLIYEITTIPCPACNMSRALLSLGRGDLAQYVAYNFMALPVAIVFVCELFNNNFGKYKTVLHICSATVLIINMIYYLLRINIIIY